MRQSMGGTMLIACTVTVMLCRDHGTDHLMTHAPSPHAHHAHLQARMQFSPVISQECTSVLNPFNGRESGVPC